MPNMVNKQIFATIGRFVRDAWGCFSNAVLLVLRIVTYPPRLVVLWFVRFFRLFVTIYLPLLLLALLVHAVAWMVTKGEHHVNSITQDLSNFIAPGNFGHLVGIVVSITLFGWILKSVGKAAWKEAGLMWRLFLDALKGRWFVKLKIVASLKQIRGHMTKRRLTFAESFRSFWRMTLVILVAVLVVLMLVVAQLSLKTWSPDSLPI